MASMFFGLKPNGVLAHQRGTPETVIVPCVGEGQPVVREPVPCQKNKRKVETIEIEDGDGSLNSSPQKKAMTPRNGNCSAEGSENSRDKGKAAMPADVGGESTEPGGSAPKRPRRQGGEGEGRHQEGRKRRKRRKPSVEILRQPATCPWCRMVFSNRYAVAAHGRFCRERNEQADRERERPAAPGRNFDLNRLPPEAYMPQQTLVVTWQPGSFPRVTFG